jgi:hypothetical protein
MSDELLILKDITEKLNNIGINYMLTGSLALGFYAQPRMTRDIDIVIELYKKDISKVIEIFKEDYYIDKEIIIDSIKHLSMFNIIQTKLFVKVDFIIRKNEEYRQIEFSRRKKVLFNNIEIFIVSKEDLIISKLYWIKDYFSEIHGIDIKNLLASDYDSDYLQNWVRQLNLNEIYNKCK